MVTLGIAILLASGLVAAKICQCFRLPSVTGYIIAGLLLGPTGLNLINESSIGHKLDHFTQIALMLIAFGIGEHIEIKKLKTHAKSLLWIGICETTGAFIVVSLSVYIAITLSSFQVDGWMSNDYITLAILLGAVSVATAPAATLLIIQELRAKGPLTATLMAIVAIDDGLAIMIFGLAISVTQQLVGHAGEPLYLALGLSVLEIIQSLILGVITGVCLRFIASKMRNNAEIMTAGLSVLLLCSEIAIAMHLSPLLAGMAAGFTLVNKAERDVRVFRALNRFEPPIYVLFFTLAGTHLDIKALGAAGLIGVVYFLSRIAGKIAGVNIGARIAKSEPMVQKYLGFALVPQAGVAIGLIFLISSNPSLTEYASIITPVVLAGVFLSELVGPLSAKFAVMRAGEVPLPTASSSIKNANELDDNYFRSEKGIEIVPWTWGSLSHTHQQPEKVVAFGAANKHTVTGLARTATILAHYYKASPMAIRVDSSNKELAENYFLNEREEVARMGYELLIEHVPDHHIASGLVAAVEYHDARAVILGFPLNGGAANFQKVLERVIENVHCPVVVIRFYGQLHTERILVPVTDMEDLTEVYQTICALSSVGEHKIELLYMMSSTAETKEIVAKKKEIENWLVSQQPVVELSIKAIPTASRVDVITSESQDYDLVVMGATRTRGVSRFFFGSLADAVSKELRKPMIIVYNTEKSTLP